MSPADYKKCAGAGAVPAVFNRALYEIRPLTDREAAEVAFERSAPKRWAAEGRIGAYRQIVEFGAAEKIDGMWVDTDDAQHVLDAYDGMKPAHQQEFARLPVVQQCHAARRRAALESAI